MNDLRTDYDLACPACRQAQRLHIAVTCTAEVTIDGSDTFGGHEWHERSPCRCPECGHSGLVEDFKAQPEAP